MITCTAKGKFKAIVLQKNNMIPNYQVYKEYNFFVLRKIHKHNDKIDIKHIMHYCCCNLEGSIKET